MTDKLIDRIKAHNSAPTIYDAPDPVEMAKRILADEQALKKANEALKAADELTMEITLGGPRDTVAKKLAAYNEKRGER